MNEVLTPLERALRQQSEDIIKSFMIIGAPVSNNFFPTSEQEVLYKYPNDLTISDKVITFLKSPTPFERISVKKYLETERMHPAVTILPGSGLSQFAVIVSHLEPVCMHSTLINGPTVLPSTVSSFNAVRRFYIFLCLQPHVIWLVKALKIIIEFDFGKKLALLSGKKEESHELKKADLEELIRSLITSKSPQLEFHIVQTPNKQTNYKDYTIVLTNLCKNKIKKEIIEKSFHSLKVRYTTIYPLPNMMLLCDFSIPILFTTLPLNIILDLFESILLETSVILTSTRPTLFTAGCFGLLSLLHPLSWQGVFLPMVPQSHIELLDVPVPGIFGTQPLKGNPSNSGLLVNIDAFTPALNGEKKKQIQQLPPSRSVLPEQMRNSLIAAIEIVMNNWKGKIKGNECEFTTEIMNIFWVSFFNKLFHNIIILNCDTIEDLKNNIFKLPEDDELNKNFLMRFIQTQHFNTWWFSQYLNYKKEWTETVCGNK
ncbi:hypothetical protein EDI_272950 [Entamoeba dispar SAW760]|uniref:UDENN domain-containing protein n=1 Tax=Entamoeba dispar (strain ATCC PRA-260 / SAW760) TaxID=370354 RepID=B0EU43_ENTDS|nr:uncharacterized protein EDI_272950 [Entamoeba dispar SAW760]EDR21960.1 hypothetical protein EDI_272950 [Entamoeba dispar SAW760]|eukprot:EDR21960.1 hypothetical protein EDI_272950 [Entamoeba dispar SAW760]